MMKRAEHYPWSSDYWYMYPEAIQPRLMKVEANLEYYVGTLEERRRLYCETMRGM
ncbi:hypothetical protein [Halalkalibacter alkaliphilus]|uniref:Uncharacterized protein n=1 Tax=Halalkalibacter alkaliphilus TaxID=2917993 RepID=A0A9X2I920_9BACI|nr:hypothetical protein [Halalkalibacter alkaliphilus]MCL7749184.1 hypothetical protein [Halalkalibacter alkaliphilus]